MHLSCLYEDIESRVQHLATTYNLLPVVVRNLATLDPTPNGKFLTWICKNYRKKLVQYADIEENLKAQLTKFETIKNKQEFKTKYPTDINQYDPAGLNEVLEEFGEQSGRQDKQKGRAGQITLPTGSKLVLNKPPYQVIKITEPKASETLCSGTKWCTANAETALDYLKHEPLYLVYKNGKRKYLVDYVTDQFRNLSNEEVSNELIFELVDLLEPVTGRSKETYPRFIYIHALSVIKGRWPEGEVIILKDSKWAKDPKWAYLYARDIIKGQWPEAEAIIATDPQYACEYARDVIQGRWPEAEAVITEHPDWAYTYAKDIIKGRWPEAEAIIATNPYFAFQYAKYVIKGRFPEAEATIAKDPESASKYAELFGL